MKNTTLTLTLALLAGSAHAMKLLTQAGDSKFDQLADKYCAMNSNQQKKSRQALVDAVDQAIKDQEVQWKKDKIKAKRKWNKIKGKKNKKNAKKDFNEAQQAKIDDLELKQEAIEKETKDLKEECERREDDDPVQSDTEESEPDEPSGPTDPVPVSRTCNGAVNRLKNEQTANIFENFRYTGAAYQDISFPADTTSFYWTEATKPDEQARKLMLGIEGLTESWARISSISPDGSLWGEKDVRPAAVVQGYLGDCWWLGAAAALAEHPERIKKVIPNYNTAAGIYEFQFFRQGIAQKVVIDDRLPVFTHSNKLHPVMSKVSRNKAWWLPLMEKATAKFYGTYENLDGGSSILPWQMLTGFPSKRYFHDNLWNVDLKELIKNADDTHEVMTTGVGSICDTAEKVGLVCHHVYSLLGHTTWNGIDFVLIRNPYGHSEWKGAYSDHDQSYNSNAFRSANSHQLDVTDGKFWIQYSDYMKYFDETVINYYLDDYKKTVEEFTWKRSTSTTNINIKLKNPVNQHVFVGLIPNQDKQFMDNQCEVPERFSLGWADQWREVNFVLESSSRQTVKSNDGESTKKMSGRGNEWFNVQNLPAGTYTLKATYATVDTSMGTLPFSVNAYASNTAVTVS